MFSQGDGTDRDGTLSMNIAAGDNSVFYRVVCDEGFSYRYFEPVHISHVCIQCIQMYTDVYYTSVKIVLICNMCLTPAILLVLRSGTATAP